MIDRALLTVLAGCAVFGGLFLFELVSPSPTDEPVRTSRPADPVPTKPARSAMKVAELAAAALAAPLFSPTRQPAETAETSGGPELRAFRLTGIVVEPTRRLAIFAPAVGKPLVRAEGETFEQWRVDRISSRDVSLSSPGGVRTLAPTPDPSLARSSTSAVAQEQRKPDAAAAAATPDGATAASVVHGSLSRQSNIATPSTPSGSQRPLPPAVNQARGQ